MSNYVTYYNGQRVEITQETKDAWLAGNPGDLGRIGAAFANDDANLAYTPPVSHPATLAVSSASSYAPAAVYAPPTTETQAGDTGAIVPSGSDGRITGTMALTSAGGLLGPAAAGATVNVTTPGASAPAVIQLGSMGIPTWAVLALAAGVVFLVLRER